MIKYIVQLNKPQPIYEFAVGPCSVCYEQEERIALERLGAFQQPNVRWEIPEGELADRYREEIMKAFESAHKLCFVFHGGEESLYLCEEHLEKALEEIRIVRKMKGD